MPPGPCILQPVGNLKLGEFHVLPLFSSVSKKLLFNRIICHAHAESSLSAFDDFIYGHDEEDFEVPTIK